MRTRPSILALALLGSLLSFVACEPAVDARPALRRAGDVARPIGDIVWLSEAERSSSRRRTDAPRVPQSKILYDVRALLIHPDMQGARIEVRLVDQHVFLTGSAPTGTQADWAESAARSVYGVSAVTNRIRIAR